MFSYLVNSYLVSYVPTLKNFLDQSCIITNVEVNVNDLTLGSVGWFYYMHVTVYTSLLLTQIIPRSLTVSIPETGV